MIYNNCLIYIFVSTFRPFYAVFVVCYRVNVYADNV